jgi:ankyrin repeat protein
VTLSLHFGSGLLSLVATFLGAYQEYTQEFHTLLWKGEIEKAKALLAKDPALKNARNDWDLRTPLHVAVWRGQVEMVKLLIDLGVNINAQDRNGFTPLHLTEDPAIAKLLIAHKADLEAKSFGGTPLESMTERLHDSQPAFAQKLRATANILLDAGAYYSIRAATYLDDPERVKVILKDDPKQSLDKYLLTEAVDRGRTAIVKLLLDHKADPNTTTEIGDYPVLYLALEHADIVRLLIKAGANPKISTDERIKEAWGKRENMTLLHHAAKKGFVETAKLLIEGGADINSRGSEYERTPLEIAASYGHVEMVKLLLKNKASVKDDNGLQTLDWALRGVGVKRLADYRSILTLLGEAGVPLNLHAIIVLGDVNRVRKLLKDRSGLISSVYDEQGLLLLAVNLKQKEMVAALLDAGVPINGSVVAWDGSTALHLATWGDKEDIAKLLIDRKADVNARDKWGATPLHEAAKQENSTVVKLLLDAKADVNAKDKRGKTPLDWAKESDKEIIELLKKHGGK